MTAAELPTPPDTSAAQASVNALLRLLDRPVAPPDLDAGALDAAMPVESRAGGSVGVLIFRLAGETLAVPAKALRRVTTPTPVSPIPHRSTGLLRGLCAIRGELILCADLRRLLGLPGQDDAPRPAHTDADPRRMVVIGPAEGSWVFEVEALVGVERIDPARLVPAPVTVEKAIGGFVLGLADLETGRVTVLDAARLLAGLEAALS